MSPCAEVLRWSRPVPGSGDAKDTDEVMVDVGGIPKLYRQDRGPVQPLGPLPGEVHEHEEALEVNGVARGGVQPEGTQRTVQKALVWARLKKEVAMLRLKTSVECSDAVKG